MARGQGSACVSRSLHRVSCTRELLDVVHQAEHLPLPIDPRSAAQREARETFVIAHVPKHGLDDAEATAVESASFQRVNPLFHPRRVRVERHLTKQQRLNEVICRLTLGDVEAVLKRPAQHHCAASRNEAMHSNLYLKHESRISHSRQQAQNEIRFAVAHTHLARAMRQFSDYRLGSVDDVLIPQPKRG